MKIIKLLAGWIYRVIWSFRRRRTEEFSIEMPVTSPVLFLPPAAASIDRPAAPELPDVIFLPGPSPVAEAPAKPNYPSRQRRPHPIMPRRAEARHQERTERQPRLSNSTEGMNETGEFWFREDILDRLDQYMTYIRRMRKLDRDAYGLYSKIGASIVPHKAPFNEQEISTWWLQTRPSFGAIALHIGSHATEEDKQTKFYHAKFVYIVKFEKAPVGVQLMPPGWSIYQVNLMWDKKDCPDNKKGPFGDSYHIAVNDAGEVIPLLSLVNGNQIIRHKQGRLRGEISQLRRQRWGIPQHIIRWAEENGTTAPDLMRRLFITVCTHTEQSRTSMIRVNCTKGDVMAVFGVHITRTPYFFKDRDVIINQAGTTARIFHITRVHKRTLADGREIPVKTHFRGLREFTWMGYAIRITVPGIDHTETRDINIGLVDSENMSRKELRTAGTMPEMGNFLADMIKTGNYDEKHFARFTHRPEHENAPTA